MDKAMKSAPMPRLKAVAPLEAQVEAVAKRELAPPLREDKVLAILAGTGAKRPAKKAQVEFQVFVGTDRVSGEQAYTVTANGRIVEEGTGPVRYAIDRADERAATVRQLGKTTSVEVL